MTKIPTWVAESTVSISRNEGKGGRKSKLSVKISPV